MNTIVLTKEPQILKDRREKNIMKLQMERVPKEFVFDHFNLEFPTGKGYLTVECLLDGDEPAKTKYSISGMPGYLILLPDFINETDPKELKKIEAEYGYDYRYGCLRIWGNHLSGDDYDDLVDRFLDFAKKESGFYPAMVSIGLVVLSEITNIMRQSLERKKLIKKSFPRKFKYSREHRLSTSQKKIWLMEDIIQYTCDQFIEHKGSYTINCPCWEVRGHYRHYKSGKVVFIKSYKKGKQKDKAEPKPHEYYLDKSMQ